MSGFDPTLRTHRETDLLSTDASGQLVRRRLRLRVVSGPAAGAEAILDRGSLFVGSGPNAELRVDDPRVSRAHVEIALLPSGARVKDLDSTNGTFIGDSRVEVVRVQAPVELRLGGQTRIEITHADLPVAPPPSRATSFGELVGASAAMRQLFAVLERVAPTTVPLAIEGPPGAGKTTAAVAVHAASLRAEGPLERIDLRAALVAGELQAAFERAAGGTMVLEHADAIPAWVTRELMPILDRVERGELDVRLVSTSSEDLRERVEAGAWSRDLFFRLAVVRATIPPLRERMEDLPLTVATLGERLTGAPLRMSDADLHGLRAHDFPDNVRELRRAIEEVLVLRPAAADESGSPILTAAAAELEGVPFKDAKEQVVDTFEREYVRRLLERHGGNVSRAAAEAGISRNHLTTLAQKHGLR